MPATMENRLNELTLQLHAGCRLQPVDRFQDWALDLIEPLIGFDIVLWASGALIDGRPFVMQGHTRGVPDGAVELLNRHSHLDPIGVKAFMNPGRTILRDAHDPNDTPPEFRRLVCDPMDLRWAMVTFSVDPQSGVFNALSLNRRPGGSPYDEDTRQAKEWLMPHLHQALTANRIERAADLFDAGHRAKYASIVCALNAIVVASEPAATTRIRDEWPAWTGGQLPAEIRSLVERALASRTPEGLLTRQSFVRAFPSADQVLIRIRARDRIDALGQRERLVAEHYADGSSAKEIARTLGISPSTVSNQLTSIYAKLGVTNKAELARLIEQMR